MRAVAQDTEASAMMGIDVNRTISVTFFLAGVARRGRPGSSTCSSSHMRYDTGFELGLIAFTAAVLGGIGNLDRRRARRAPDRPHPGLQRGARLDSRRERLDALDRVRDPDRRPSSSGPRASSASGRRRAREHRSRRARARGLARSARRGSPARAADRRSALLYPLYVDYLRSLPLIGDFVPATELDGRDARRSR